MQDGAQELDEAVKVWRKQLACDPYDLDVMHRLGVAHLQRGAPADAVTLLIAVAKARPDGVVQNDLGSALGLLGHVDAAVARFEAALAQRPDSPEILTNLATALVGQGNAHLASGKAIDAETCYRRAVACQPGLVEAIANLGTSLVAQNRLAEGINAYHRALSLRPGNADCTFALALAQLFGGHFVEGWRNFESRRDVTSMTPNYRRRSDAPLCRPQDLLVLPSESRVLLLAEQGLGDMIQYARYAPLLAERGLRVTLEAHEELRSLFTTLPGVTVIGRDDPAPACDAACFLLSLPLAFGTNLASVPANVPYLSAPAEQTRDTGTGLRIGLVVSGDSSHPHDRHRSIALANLATLFGVTGCRFILVQRDIRDGDRDTIATTPALQLPAQPLSDFAVTAALLSQLDLLITVDTAVAHLAGALALPVWLLLRFSPDYRWLLGRTESPWYPTMRLYRQPAPGDWEPVIEAVRRDLSDLRRRSGM